MTLQPLNKKTMLALGVVAFVIGLFWQAPASLISMEFAKHSGEKVLLTEAVGTIWNGRAKLALSSALGQETIGEIKWEILPTKLLVGKLDAIILWNQSAPTLLSLSQHSISLQNVSLDIPASAITHFMPSLSAAQLGGQIHITSKEITISNNQMSGIARLAWSQATSPLSQINPIGEYQMMVQGAGNILNIQLSTLNGALKLEGSGEWAFTSGLHFQGSANADEPHKMDMLPLLHIIGNKEAGNGSNYMININL